MDLNRLGEFGLIHKIQSRIPARSKRVLKGIGDDCAVYAGKNGIHTVISTDALVEKVHFDLKTHSPEQLGRKALAVNVSDIAAMGATPLFAVITLGIPKKIKVEFIDRFYKGLNKACQEYNLDVVGGDTVSSPNVFFVNVTIVGETFKNRLFTRKGARAGDAICVTGTLGDSALGLKILKSRKTTWQGNPTQRNKLVQRHILPTPRLEVSQHLAQSRMAITSMIDVSDGLTQDLQHLLTASRTGAELWEDQIPLSKAFEKFSALNNIKPQKLALGGGEDYELLFTINSDNVKKLVESCVQFGVPVTQIGVVSSQPGIVLVQPAGRRKLLQKPLGFNHFG